MSLNVKQISLGIAGGVILLLGSGYLGAAGYYHDHFLPGTQIAGVQVDNLTSSAAQAKVARNFHHQTITLKDGKKTLHHFSYRQLGLRSVSLASMNHTLAQQNPWLFKRSSLAANTDRLSKATVTQLVQKQLSTLNRGRRQPQNATIAKKAQTLTIIPEVSGTTWSKETVAQQIIRQFKAGRHAIQLKGHYEQPTITQHNVQLKRLLASAKKISQLKAQITISGQTVTIPTSVLSSSLKVKDNTLALETTVLQRYLAQLNNQFATINKTRQFKTTKGKTVSVTAGTYGWSLAQQATLQKLTPLILKGKDFTTSAIIQGSGYHSNGTDIGSTYVEVSKTAQHMWIYIDGKLKISTDVVTGDKNDDRETPSGVFYVWRKQKNATLRGTNSDGSTYASAVNYWMPIDYTGVGLHDSPWQPTYGGDWYLNHGSHGCVNTPPTTMKKVFDTVPLGTPVVIY